MTENLDLEVGGGPEPGTYLASLTSLTPFTYTDDASGETKTLLRWEFLIDSSELTVEGVSSTSTANRAKSQEWMAGLLGRKPERGDKLGSWTRERDGAWTGMSPLVGKFAQVVVEEDDKGFSKVSKVVPVPKAPGKRA